MKTRKVPKNDINLLNQILKRVKVYYTTEISLLHEDKVKNVINHKSNEFCDCFYLFLFLQFKQN